MYGAYLVFQLWSHAHLYDDKINRDQIARSTRYPTAKGRGADVETGNGEEEEEEEPQMALWLALSLLAAVTVLVAITAEFLVSSIDGLYVFPLFTLPVHS